MKYLKYKVFGVFCFMSFQHLFGQDRWTLDSCVKYALENSYQVKQNLLDLETKKIQLNATKMSTLPSLGLSVGQDFDFGRAATASAVIIDNTQSTTTFGVGFNMPIFNGLKTYHQMASDKLDIKAAIHQLEQVKENISLNVTAYYLQVLLYKEMLRSAKTQVIISEEQVQRTEELVNNGKNAQADLYNAKATLANDVLTVTNYQNQLRLGKLDLAQLMNVADPQSFDITEPDTDSVFFENVLNQFIDIKAITVHSLQHRPGIKVAETLIKKGESDVKIARSGYYPTLNLSASYGTGYYYSFNSSLLDQNHPFGTQFKNNSREIVGVSLNFPLFDRLSTYYNVKMSKIGVRLQTLQLEEAKRNIIKEIEQAYTEAIAAKDKYQAAKIAREAAQLAFQYEEVKFNAGTSTQYEYNEAKIKYEKAISSEIQAKYDFLLRREILKYYGS
ncbi:MAG: TolC family protein [Bacteroidales bacterium]